MTDAGQPPSAGPLVCPFVALAEDRDRRADAPDEGNRCYAEKAPRRRDLVYQADYCYSSRFASCSVFLSWAARNAAEPAYVTDAARRAWGSGIAMPEHEADVGGGALEAAADTLAAIDVEGVCGPVEPTLESGLFGPPEADEAAAGRSGSFDWVSATAWSEVPWDEHAEAEADELEALAAEPPDEPSEEPEAGSPDEDLIGPRVPAALPLRRRRAPAAPIRARGSGEWLYAEPSARQPLVRRRSGVGPPILLAVLGLLVVSLIVFLLPSLLGGDGAPAAAVSSPSPGASSRPAPTRAPSTTALPSTPPSPTPEPEIRTYTVKSGDTLYGIAARLDVNMRLLQCLNMLSNPNLLQPGQKLLVPPDGYSCPPGWRRASPEPEPVEPESVPAEEAGPDSDPTASARP